MAGDCVHMEDKTTLRMLSRLVDVLDERSAGGARWLGPQMTDNLKQEFLAYRQSLTSKGVRGDALIDKLDAWIIQKGFPDTLKFVFDVGH